MGAIVNGLDAALSARVRGDVLHVQRLHARLGPAGGADEAAVDLRLHARLDRPRGGRPDPPADRAPRGPAGDADAVGRPSRRRQRDRAGVALCDRHEGRPTALVLSRQGVPTWNPSAIPDRRDRARRLRAALLLQGARARPDPDRDGHRGAHLPRAADTLEAEGIATRVVSMPCMEHFAAPGRGLPRRGAAASVPGPGVGRGSRPHSAGTGGSASWARSIGMETFGASAPAERAVQALRLHARERLGDGTRRGEASKNVTGGGKMSTATEVNPRLQRSPRPASACGSIRSAAP